MTNEEDNNDVPAEGNILPDPAAQLEALTAQMKQNDENLAQLKADNASLRAENASRDTEEKGTNVNARTRFQTHVTQMQPS